jgi:hypothetical protein
MTLLKQSFLALDECHFGNINCEKNHLPFTIHGWCKTTLRLMAPQQVFEGRVYKNLRSGLNLETRAVEIIEGIQHMSFRMQERVVYVIETFDSLVALGI